MSFQLPEAIPNPVSAPSATTAEAGKALSPLQLGMTT